MDGCPTPSGRYLPSIGALAVRPRLNYLDDYSSKRYLADGDCLVLWLGLAEGRAYLIAALRGM